MIYGVPQSKRSKITGRVKMIKLEAESGAEELFLTKLEEYLDSGKNIAIMVSDEKTSHRLDFDRSE